MRIASTLVSLGLLYYCANAQDPTMMTANPHVDKVTPEPTTLASIVLAATTTAQSTTVQKQETALATTTKPTLSARDQTTRETTKGIATSPSQVSSGGSDSAVDASAGLATATSPQDPNPVTTTVSAVPAALSTHAPGTAVPTVIPATRGLAPAETTLAPGGIPGAVSSTTVPPSQTSSLEAGTEKSPITPSATQNPHTSPTAGPGVATTMQSITTPPARFNPPIVTTTESISSSVTEASTLTTAAITTPTTTATTTEVPKPFSFKVPFSKGDMDHQRADITQLCKRLTRDMDNGTCIVNGRDHNGRTEIDSMQISGHVDTRLARQYYEEINNNKRPQRDNTVLIAILASCGALLAIIVGGAIYVSRHRKPYCENQQHLTEELQTVENGYHDNPTLEVMEVQPEMQEKKQALNGEFNDSWIVPIDNLLKDDTPDEEDTHL